MANARKIIKKSIITLVLDLYCRCIQKPSRIFKIFVVFQKFGSTFSNTKIEFALGIIGEKFLGGNFSVEIVKKNNGQKNKEVIFPTVLATISKK